MQRMQVEYRKADFPDRAEWVRIEGLVKRHGAERVHAASDAITQRAMQRAHHFGAILAKEDWDRAYECKLVPDTEAVEAWLASHPAERARELVSAA